jgi:NADPH-dependent curcumin reductase CurA
VQEMAQWHKDGQLKFQEHVVEGDVSAFPNTLKMLFTGENRGKLVLKLN